MQLAQGQYWNRLPGGNVISTTEWLGADFGSTIPLRIQTRANQPIEWYTDAVQRMRLMPTLTGQTVNGYTGLNLSGHLGLGGPVPTRPLAYIHINSNGSHFAGYRPWMRVGTFMSENNDGMYVGTKREDDDRIDAVLNWFDNDQDSPGVGPDALRFIFTRASSGSSVAAGDDGLEMARLIPVPNGNEGYFGIGDFFTPGLQPAERLDVLNGRVRIRQLPTDPAANTLNRFMVVDNTGVVKWRYLPPSSTTNCDWEMNTGGHLLTTAWRPAGTNGNCPDANWKVGIGTASPQFKMEVIDVEDDSIPTIGGLRVDLRTNHLGWRYGVKSYLEPKHGGVKLAYGAAVQGDIVNAGLDGPGNADAYGVLGRSTTNEDLYLRSSMGVTGTAINSSGTINELLGGDFFGANTGGTVTATYGVRGRAYSNIAGAKCYGVHGTAPVDTNSWAGYFQGKVRATNYMMASMYYTYSDASIKAGVENLEQADVSAKLAALVPRRYHYTPEAQERFGLPAGEQFGFVAQEVEAVVPELVVVSRMPEELDSAGTVIFPEMEIKAVNYQELIPLLVQGYQQQQATIAQLKQQVAQCCAADQGMAPQDVPTPKDAPQTGDLQEQKLLIIPNPVADLTTLEYYVPHAGRVSLSVSTSDGKPLGTLREEQAEPGVYSYQWNTTRLAAGTYFCTFLLDGNVVVKRAVKVK